MDQPQSEPFKTPYIKCSIHDEPACALKCLDLEAGPPVKCILCIIKEKLNGEDLISLSEIFKPNAEQVSNALPHLSDEQLTKLKKIQSDNHQGMLATIESYFESLKVEVINIINEQQKISIKQAYELIERQKELNEKYSEFISIKDLQDLISTNQNNQDNLNEELKKYFKEFFEIQQERQQEIQQLIKNYENIPFREDISNILKKNILSSIRQLIFFQVSSEDKAQENDEIKIKQQEFLQLLVKSSETLSYALSRSTSLFKQNEPLDFSSIDALLIEDRSQEACKNPKELLSETQSKLLNSSKSNKSVNQIIQILVPLAIPQRLDALSVIVKNLPTLDIINKILFKTEISKCQFVSSQFPQSNPISSKKDISIKSMAETQLILNQGFSSLYSDCILNPKLKYKLEIHFNCQQNTRDACSIGLLPNIQKDEKLMSEFYAIFPNSINQQSQQLQQEPASFVQNQPSQSLEISFCRTIFICISERIFIVCNEKGDIIQTIPEASIQSTTQYRIGIQFQSIPNQALNQIPLGGSLFGNGNNQMSSIFGVSYQQSQAVQSLPFKLNLIIQSFSIMNAFPSF